MTRNEEIKQALSRYVKNRGVSGNHIVDVERDAAFIAGALYADRNPDTSSMWHDANEEPEGVNWEILCQDEHDCCWVENRIEAQLLHKNWNAYTEIEMIVRWAYIKDLLPKGGEK